jgi:hypothetical protein
MRVLAPDRLERLPDLSEVVGVFFDDPLALFSSRRRALGGRLDRNRFAIVAIVRGYLTSPWDTSAPLEKPGRPHVLMYRKGNEAKRRSVYMSGIVPHLGLRKLTPDIRAALATGRADEAVGDIGQPDMVRPLIAAHLN